MRDLLEFCNIFDGTFAAETIAQVQAVYSDLQKKSDAFINAYSIHCPPGCGSCCEHFLPDITQAEALCVAVYLLFVKKDYSLISKLESAAEQENPPCPLYNPNSCFHCQVYQARPLICRLFGACANTDKEGNAVFRKCRFNSSDSMPETLTITDSRPAEMADFALRLNSISPDVTEMLPKAVLKAMQKIQILAGAVGYIDHDDDDTPNPTPTPMAS